MNWIYEYLIYFRMNFNFNNHIIYILKVNNIYKNLIKNLGSYC